MCKELWWVKQFYAKETYCRRPVIKSETSGSYWIHVRAPCIFRNITLLSKCKTTCVSWLAFHTVLSVTVEDKLPAGGSCEPMFRFNSFASPIWQSHVSEISRTQCQLGCFLDKILYARVHVRWNLNHFV